ncbi:MAG: c-type cytochrome biogenesis protein CcmI [Pseudomonadota bacterium]
MFWLVTGAIVIAVGLTLWQALRVTPDASARPSAAFDLDLYRRQLRELDRDVARGVIGKTEAERARLEISRRILEADARASKPEAGRQGGRLPYLALLLVPALAYTLYAGTASMLRAAGWSDAEVAALSERWSFAFDVTRDGAPATIGPISPIFEGLGVPGAPDVPIAERIAAIEAARAARPSQAEAEAGAPRPPAVALDARAAAELEALRADLEAGGGDAAEWLALARGEAERRNYIAAHRAQAEAAARLGIAAGAQVYVDLARLQILAAGGYISPEAEAALTRALAINPDDGQARFLVGAMYQHQNRPDLAFALWRDLLADSQPDDPWIVPILQSIEEVAARAGQRLDPGAIAPRGPTAADIAAAEDLTPEERAAMIEGMVSGLAERLATEGGPAQDWAQLIRGLAVLGRLDQARAIHAEAREVFNGDPPSLQLIEEAATLLTGQAE